MKLFKASKLKSFSSYFIELVIVVVGVSIAFQLNVWNDDRKAKELEQDLLENFRAENRANLIELDSSIERLTNSLDASFKLIDVLKQDSPDPDSVQLILIDLYSISWPDINTIHLDNFLEQTSAISQLNEELLALNANYKGIEDITSSYIEQKQTKFFDYLTDAIDMNDNMKIVNMKKLVDIRFRNNIMIIAAYEQSLIDTMKKVIANQQKLNETMLSGS